MIDKLKLDDRVSVNDEYKYIDEDGTSWKSKSDYLQINILDFCGCGNGNEVMRYIQDHLINLENQEWGSYEDIPTMFLLYWLNHKGFSEHGTTVRCSWLTDLGKELLADINWCLEHEKEED
tara:strand:+ start:4729 stop:5091 length:363 start_codon:yes stop_codon:yes gene_type:complete